MPELRTSETVQTKGRDFLLLFAPVLSNRQHEIGRLPYRYTSFEGKGFVRVEVTKKGFDGGSFLIDGGIFVNDGALMKDRIFLVNSKHSTTNSFTTNC